MLKITQSTILNQALVIAFLIWVVGLFASRMETWLRSQHFVGKVIAGVLLGICFLDVLPHVVEETGWRGLAISLVFFVLYSVFHILHMDHAHEHQHDQSHLHRHHEHRDQSSGDHGDVSCHSDHQIEEHYHHSLPLVLMALFAHQFSNGVWLGLADGQKVSFEMSLFWAILLHKLFEVLLVVSLITIDYRFKKNEKNYLRWMPQFLLFTYCILLPLGTAIGLQHWVREYQFIVANFAAGSLMGCLVFDFIGPVANDARHEFRRSLGAGFSSLAGVFVGFILSGVWHLFLDYYIDHYLS